MKERALSGHLFPSARAVLAGFVLAVPAFALHAQQSEDASPVFVEQTPGSEVLAPPPVTTPTPDRTASKVFFPDEITPETVAQARARAAEQEQLQRSNDADREIRQLSEGGEGARDMVQLSDGDSARALAQLTPAERQVLLDAVEGTDICDRIDNIPTIRDLCEGRLETRSAEFAPKRTGGSAEDNLLGGRFDTARTATLEAAIARLARNSGRAEDFSDQAIASVALGQQSALGDAEASAAEGDPANDLSPETQAVVNAIVQQLGNN